jgi:hypothetical protein
MTAPAPIRTDFSALDQNIARALVALRLARARSAADGVPGNHDAEDRAEADLNGLLEYRHSVLRRRAS